MDSVHNVGKAGYVIVNINAEFCFLYFLCLVKQALHFFLGAAITEL